MNFYDDDDEDEGDDNDNNDRCFDDGDNDNNENHNNDRKPGIRTGSDLPTWSAPHRRSSRSWRLLHHPLR